LVGFKPPWDQKPLSKILTCRFKRIPS